MTDSSPRNRTKMYIPEEVEDALEVTNKLLPILLGLGIILHSYGIYTLYKDRSRRTKKLSNHNIILISLSIVELSLNILLIFKMQIDCTSNIALIKLWAGLEDALLMIHGCVMIVIAVNRWLVFQAGVRYKQVVTRKRLITTLIAVYITGTFFTLPSAFSGKEVIYSHNFKTYRVVFHIMFILVTIVIYRKICRKFKRRYGRNISEPLFKQTQFLVISMIIVAYIVFFSLTDIVVLILRRCETITKRNRDIIEPLFLFSWALGIIADAAIYIFFKPSIRLFPWKKNPRGTFVMTRNIYHSRVNYTISNSSTSVIPVSPQLRIENQIQLTDHQPDSICTLTDKVVVRNNEET